MGVRVLRTPPFAPQANSYCERLIGSTHREYLDFLIPLSENYLRRVLADWRDYYNQARHSSFRIHHSAFIPHSSFRIHHSSFIIHHSSLITGTQCPCAGERSSRRSCFAEALYSNWIPHRFLADSRRAPSRLSVGTHCLTERRPQTQGLSPSLEASALALAFYGLNAVQASRTRHVRADRFRRSGPISELRCRFDRPTLFFADHTLSAASTAPQAPLPPHPGISRKTASAWFHYAGLIWERRAKCQYEKGIPGCGGARLRRTP